MKQVTTLMAEAAALAPSIHNSQPWHFVIAPDRLEVLADLSRATPASDPVGRGLWLACGAAALNALVTARSAGRACSVAIGPQRGRSDLVAVLSLGGAIEPLAEDVALARAVPLRHTVRTPFEARNVPREAVDRLRSAVETEGAWMAVVDRPDEIIELAVLTEHAEAAENADEAYRSELRTWLRAAGDERPDGIPVDLVAGVTVDRGSDVPLRTFVHTDPEPTRSASAAEPPRPERPLLVAVGTDSDREVDWIRAGLAMQRMWLTATADGLVASPMTQALEHAAFRTRLRFVVGMENGHPQMLMRIGYGSQPAATTRRPLTDLVVGF